MMFLISNSRILTVQTATLKVTFSLINFKHLIYAQRTRIETKNAGSGSVIEVSCSDIPGTLLRVVRTDGFPIYTSRDTARTSHPASCRDLQTLQFNFMNQGPGLLDTRFKAYRVELYCAMRHWFNSRGGKEFSASEWDRYQVNIVRNLGTFCFVAVIPV